MPWDKSNAVTPIFMVSLPVTVWLISTVGFKGINICTVSLENTTQKGYVILIQYAPRTLISCPVATCITEYVTMLIPAVITGNGICPVGSLIMSGVLKAYT